MIDFLDSIVQISNLNLTTFDIIIDKLPSSVSKVTSLSWEIVTHLHWKRDFCPTQRYVVYFFSFVHSRINLITTRPFVRLYSSIRSSVPECKNYKVFIYKFTFRVTIVISRERHHFDAVNRFKKKSTIVGRSRICADISSEIRALRKKLLFTRCFLLLISSLTIVFCLLSLKFWMKKICFFRLQFVRIRNNLVVISNFQSLLNFKLTSCVFFSGVHVIMQVGLMTSSRDYIFWNEALLHEFLH